MIENSQLWMMRAEEVLAQPLMAPASEAVQFAVSMLSAFYGPDSPQMRQFRDGCTRSSNDLVLHQHAAGAIRNTLAELKAGLITRVRVVVAGEILQELVRLAREIMLDHSEEAKNAAAVLAAAAYEGLMRRMGEELAAVTDRPKLEVVIGKLKDANVLKGAEVGVALSYLKFRNDSLHADWKNVERSVVDSCLAFDESLLLKHFAG